MESPYFYLKLMKEQIEAAYTLRKLILSKMLSQPIRIRGSFLLVSGDLKLWIKFNQTRKILGM